MARRFKTCLCTYTKGKPVVHNENTVESQRLEHYFPKEGKGNLKLEIRLNSQEMTQVSACLLRMSKKECLYLKMRMMLQNTVTYFRVEVKVVMVLQRLKHPRFLIFARK